MTKVLTQIYVLAVFVLLASCSPAGDALQVQEIWARPGLSGGNSAVYFRVDNGTAGNDTLLSASSDAAEAVELHLSTMEDGKMRMQMQEEVPLPPGETEFKPGGLHVMLIGLEQDLQPGDTFEVTLQFATAGDMLVSVPVREP